MENLTRILCFAHSGLRWLVVLAALAALLVLLIGFLRKRGYSGINRGVMSLFSSAVGLQWVLGLVFLVAYGIFAPYQWVHTGIMTGALATAHVHYMLKRRPDRVRYLGGLGAILVTLVLIYVGVAALPTASWAFSGACRAFTGG